VFSQSDRSKELCESMNVNYINYGNKLESQIDILKKHSNNLDIILASARVPGKASPVIITKEVLKGMREGSVVCDIARTEGGNVEGSRDDSDLVLEGVIVTNTTG